MAEQQKDFFSELKSEIKDLGSKVNKMFDDVVRGKDRAVYHVSADIYETAEMVIYELDLPGVAKTDFNVQVRDNKLVVKGMRKPAFEGGVTKHLSERGFGEFAREFIVPAGVDTAQVKAKFENGILRVTLPKESVEVDVAEVAVD